MVKNPKPTMIRGLDEEQYKKARADALDRDIPIGTWMNEAIKEKLEGQGIIYWRGLLEQVMSEHYADGLTEKTKKQVMNALKKKS